MTDWPVKVENKYKNKEYCEEMILRFIVKRFDANTAISVQT